MLKALVPTTGVATAPVKASTQSLSIFHSPVGVVLVSGIVATLVFACVPAPKVPPVAEPVVVRVLSSVMVFFMYIEASGSVMVSV